MARKPKDEPLTAAPAEDATVPQEIIDVIPGDIPTFQGWNDESILTMQQGWPEKTGTRTLPVALSDSELVAVSDERNYLEDQCVQAEAAAAAAKAHCKATLERLEGEIGQKRRTLRTKKEEREVPTRWFFGVRPGSDGTPIPCERTKTLVRTDTWEVVTSDSITDADRQTTLWPEEEAQELTADEEEDTDTDEDTDEDADQE